MAFVSTSSASATKLHLLVVGPSDFHNRVKAIIAPPAGVDAVHALSTQTPFYNLASGFAASGAPTIVLAATRDIAHHLSRHGAFANTCVVYESGGAPPLSNEYLVAAVPMTSFVDLVNATVKAHRRHLTAVAAFLSMGAAASKAEEVHTRLDAMFGDLRSAPQVALAVAGERVLVVHRTGEKVASKAIYTFQPRKDQLRSVRDKSLDDRAIDKMITDSEGKVGMCLFIEGYEGDVVASKCKLPNVWDPHYNPASVLHHGHDVLTSLVPNVTPSRLLVALVLSDTPNNDPTIQGDIATVSANATQGIKDIRKYVLDAMSVLRVKKIASIFPTIVPNPLVALSEEAQDREMYAGLHSLWVA